MTSEQKDNFNGWFKLKLITTFHIGFVVNITLIKNCPNKYKLSQKVIEFGTSPMFTINIATLALLDAFCFVGELKRMITDRDGGRLGLRGAMAPPKFFFN